MRVETAVNQTAQEMALCVEIGGQAMNDNLKENNIKSTELCERCVYDVENCNLKCFAGEDCKMLDGDSCKCVRVPLRTPCDYFVERDNF